MTASLNIARGSDETLTDGGDSHRLDSCPELSIPHLFVALECDRPAAGVARHSLAHTDSVTIGRGPRRSSSRSFDDGRAVLAITIPDALISARHAEIARDGDSFAVADLGSRNGTYVNDVRVTVPLKLANGDCIRVGHSLLRYREAVSVPVGAPADVDSADDERRALPRTIDPSLSRRLDALARVAKISAPILLLGESGAGKEVLARALHHLSGRTGPFVAVNCGAIPTMLTESHLFGHVRGSFSGAVADSPGLLRGAHGGTLLLDEIGDLPHVAQAALLRALQEHEVLPVGGVRPVRADFRAVAATHRPLDAMVEEGAFRSDLFARLAAYTFRLPPLRVRPEDIGLMIAEYAENHEIRFTPRAGLAVLRHRWPLNVRELHQALEVAAALAGGDAIDLVDLPAAVVSESTDSEVDVVRAASSELYDRVVASCARHRGNVSEMARELGKERKQVQRWIRRFGIDAESLRRR